MGRRTIREINEDGLRSALLVETFMSEHLRFTGGAYAGRPFRLTPHQKKHITRPLFGTLDGRGERVYREAILGRARWGGKSQIAAGLTAACMFTEPVFEGEYYVVASDKAQARIVFDKVKRMIFADPLLRAIAKPYRSVIEIPETGSIFRVLPWNADSAQGYHATVCVIDEYHVHRDASMREAMLSGMVGNRNGLLITISTAAEERKGPLWELLKTAPGDPHAYVDWIGAGDEEDGHDPKVWRACNPAPWVRLADLRKQYKTLPFPVFERLHLNRFPSKGTNRAYPASLWDPCAAPPAFDKDAPTILALDASWSRDTTALVMVQRDRAGRLHVWCMIWRKDEALGHIDHAAVEAKILELSEAYNVVRIGCDPNYFTRSMLRLEHEFGLPIEEFPQDNRRMSLACMTLYDVLQEKRLAHGGAPGLRDHVLNATVRPTPYGWRIGKTSDADKIDAAIALAIATYLAEAEAAAFAPTFAQTGGVWSIRLG